MPQLVDRDAGRPGVFPLSHCWAAEARGWGEGPAGVGRTAGAPGVGGWAVGKSGITSVYTCWGLRLGFTLRAQSQHVDILPRAQGIRAGGGRALPSLTPGRPALGALLLRGRGVPAWARLVLDLFAVTAPSPREPRTGSQLADSFSRCADKHNGLRVRRSPWSGSGVGISTRVSY